MRALYSKGMDTVSNLLRWQQKVETVWQWAVKWHTIMAGGVRYQTIVLQEQQKGCVSLFKCWLTSWVNCFLCVVSGHIIWCQCFTFSQERASWADASDVCQKKGIKSPSLTNYLAYYWFLPSSQATLKSIYFLYCILTKKWSWYMSRGFIGLLINSNDSRNSEAAAEIYSYHKGLSSMRSCHVCTNVEWKCCLHV